MTWHSNLTLAFDGRSSDKNVHTQLTQRQHKGALRVQKALYPEQGEQNGVCHVIILYPPAGIALGDKLEIEIGLQHQAQAVMTTPGANKWYGNLPSYALNKQQIENAKKTEVNLASYSSQNVSIYLQDNSRIEWLPQENCFYNASHAHSTNQFFLSPTASLIAWEINLLGREYHGEHYDIGTLQLSNLFWRVDSEQSKLLLADRVDQSAKDSWFRSPIGLNKKTVFATLWVIPSVSEQANIVKWVKKLREFIEQHQLPLSFTQIGDVLIVRYLDSNVRQCFDSFGAIRGEIRTLMWQQENHLPRIWAT